MVVGRVEVDRARSEDLRGGRDACGSIDDYQFTKDTIASIITSGLLGEVYIGLDAGGDTGDAQRRRSHREDAVGGRAGEADRPVPVRQGGGREAPANEMRTQSQHRRSTARRWPARCCRGCAAAPSKVDPFEPCNRAMFAVNEARRRRVVEARSRRPTSRRCRSRCAPACRTSSATSTTCSPASTTCCRASGSARATTSAACCSIRRSASLGIFDLASRWGITKDNEDFGHDVRQVGRRRRVRICSCRCSGRRRCATARACWCALYAGPVGFIPDVPLRNSIYGRRLSSTCAPQLLERRSGARYRRARQVSLHAQRLPAGRGATRSTTASRRPRTRSE